MDWSSPDKANAAKSVLALAVEGEGFWNMRPHRPDSAQAGFNRLRSVALRRNLQLLADALNTPEGGAFFSFILGNSPHLSGLLMRDPTFAEGLVTETPDAISGRLRRQLAETDPEMDRAELMRFLRVSRNRVAIAAAVFDCFGIWGVMQCADLLSDMADHAVRLAVLHLVLKAVAGGDLAPPAGTERCGYFALAMGKHGSQELNYSSDIDLIVLYDPSRTGYQGVRPEPEFFSRLTRGLVQILETRDANGYVFRTDLRLRPDAASTPLAIRLDFALDYYNSKGRTWERAALIKARPVAGDLEAGADFLRRVSPFIWDEGLDFTSVEQIRSMSEQIHDFHGHGAVKLAGQNVKLGRGGIREIEFFVHIHQLAYGGRSRRLRGRQVLPMLSILEREHHLMPREAETLGNAYLLLRRVEHRLQMVGDNQTQTLPESDDGLDHIATFLNLPSQQQLGTLLGSAAAEVHALYLSRFNIPEREHDLGEGVLAGPQGSADTLERLRAMGFCDVGTAVERFRGWAEGRHAATASASVQKMVREVLHDIVHAVGKTPEPDRTLERLDRFLAGLMEDVPFFSMLRANTWLLHLIAVVMGCAPHTADRLSANPRLLQAALDPSFFLPVPDPADLAADLRERLGDPGNFRTQVGRIAVWAQDRQFQVCVQTLQHLIMPEEAPASRSRIADVVIETLMQQAMENFAQRHGPAVWGWALVAVGDLGANDMIFGSNLDLVLVTDEAQDDLMATHGRPVPTRRLRLRTVQRFAAAIRAQAVFDGLRQVNLRMTSLALLREDAPTFKLGLKPIGAAKLDLVAMARARVVCGDPATVEAVKSAIQRVLTRPRDPALLRAGLAGVREALAAEAGAAQASGDSSALRPVRDGLLDLECIARLLQLRHSHESSAVLAQGLTASFEALASAGLLAQDEAASLADAARLQRAVQAYLRLTWGDDAHVHEVPDAGKARLAEAFEMDDFKALEAKLRRTQRDVLECYRHHFG